ncbi:protein D3-like [Macrobrachium nipponense]|uniref:protein D3-like n=1 Tax=Macrobrachium nipponense TaxID=159736 RepID=UPI0030C87EBC
MCRRWKKTDAYLLSSLAIESGRMAEQQQISRLMTEEIVPDVVDELPSNCVKVKYGSREVSCGNVLTPTQVFEEPTEICWPADTSNLYTLCMTDPDAPSRQNPIMREFLHWLVVNIPGVNFQKETLATVSTDMVYLAYQQPGKISCDEPKMQQLRINSSESPLFTEAEGKVASGRRSKLFFLSVENRRQFSIRNFAAKYKLKPVAGNFYQAEYDETTLKVHRQLGVIPK